MKTFGGFIREWLSKRLRPPKSSRSVDSTEQSDQVHDSIEALLELRSRHDQRASLHQLTIERLTHFLGQPFFLYGFLSLIMLWVAVNSVPYLFHQHPFDQPPFFWLQGMVSLMSLVLTTMVLITQNRLAKITERQAQLEVHINLLSERKLAKLIALVEELRQDLPIVHNRPDAEAEAMTQAADPLAVLIALEEALQEDISST